LNTREQALTEAR